MAELLNYIFWDPRCEMFDFNIPLLGRPILWYGFFFALGFLIGYWMVVYLLRRFLLNLPEFSANDIKAKASYLVEKILIHVVLGSVIGARLGEILFYQKWSTYSHDLLSIFKVWQGGLASHGGVVGVLAALFILSKRLRKEFPQFSWLRLLDFVVIPTALAGCLIRIGNFFNQEILGKATTLPWGIIFGHPADGGPIVPRHPTQLYESSLYFATFILLFCLWQYRPAMRRPGKIAGLFFMLIFSFRFCVEFFKVEQSPLIGMHSLLDMGQYLSVPLIVLGMILFFKRADEQSGMVGVKRN
jgi:phosphatidylglycerol---prolipoprotein diacylglyceryl transferase